MSEIVDDTVIIPLTSAVTIPEFPVDALPKSIADAVYALSEATQTDPAMAGTSALSALAACTGGHAVIEVRRGWREPLSLYCATVASPGERKSAVQRFLVKPLLDVEEDLTLKGFAERCEAEARKQVAVKTAEEQRAIAAKAKPEKRDEAMADAIGASQAAKEITVPPIPRLVADDVTPEAAASLLAENGGRLAIISAEGGLFDIIAGRYSKLPNMDLWLKGHAGDPVKVDRKGREPEYIRSPAITLGLMIQPEVLSAIAAHRQFRGRGLLARILYAFPTTMVGYRNVETEPVSQDIEDGYHALVSGLARQMVEWSGDPAVLTLTPDAHEAITAIAKTVEHTLADDGELAHLADWGAKYVGAIARIAGIIHLAGNSPRTSVSADTISAAAEIGAYFKACAINAFAEMGTDEGTADAIYLWERIERLGFDEVSERDLHVACKHRFKKKADLLPAVERLVDHGYLHPLPVPEPTVGRPASPRYRVTTTEQKPQKEQKGAW
jgi:hypothetical protein